MKRITVFLFICALSSFWFTGISFCQEEHLDKNLTLHIINSMRERMNSMEARIIGLELEVRELKNALEVNSSQRRIDKYEREMYEVDEQRRKERERFLKTK